MVGAPSSQCGGGVDSDEQTQALRTCISGPVKNVERASVSCAAGLALGAALFGLPWHVTGVMLAGPPAYYSEQQRSLTDAFVQHYLADEGAATLQERAAGILSWVERPAPRKFGKVLPGEIAHCKQIAQRHGIVLDPIWSLAAWEVAMALAGGQRQGSNLTCQDVYGAGGQPAEESSRVVIMLHTGGMLGLCGLAQRYPADF